LYNAKATYKVQIPNATADEAGIHCVETFFDSGEIIFGATESYQNYVDGDLTNYAQRYFGTNLPKLVQVKNLYDPDNYFRFPQSIPVEM